MRIEAGGRCTTNILEEENEDLTIVEVRTVKRRNKGVGKVGHMDAVGLK